MSSFTCSPMKLPEIIFVDISFSKYIISPCENCNEIKGCLYLLTVQIPSPRCTSALEAPRTIWFCISMLSVSFLWLWKKGTDSDSCIHPAAAGACRQEASRCWRRGAGCVFTTPSFARYRPKPLDFCSVLQTHSPPVLPHGKSIMRGNERPWFGFFFPLFFFQSVQSCP